MRTHAASRSGGALVVVLLVLVLAAALAAGWLTTVTSETAYVESLEASSRRRVALANLDAAARQYMLSNVLASAAAPGAEITLADGGTLTFQPSSGAPLLSIATAARNAFNSGNGDGYTFDLVADGEAPDGEPFSRLYRARSRSPVLSGDLFISNRPASGSNSVFGSLENTRRTMLWAPDGNAYSLVTHSFTVAPSALEAVSLPNPAGAVAPANFPFVPTTTGQLDGAPIYNGQLDVVANASGINSLAVKAAEEGGVLAVDGAVEDTGVGVTSDGAGVVTVDLHRQALPNLSLSNVSELVLDGQSTTDEAFDADGYLAVLIYIADASALTTIRLVGRNDRRLALGIRGAGGTTVVINATAADTSVPWRLVLTLENTPTTWIVPGGGALSICGGIQTDRNVSIEGGTVVLLTEPDAQQLDRLTARDAWLEAYDPPEVTEP